MSYLGRGLEQVDNISKLDNITFNGGTTYALTKDSAAFTPISSNALLVSIDGVIQQGNFSVSGTNIIFNFSPTGSNTCDFIMHYGTGVAFTPADDTVAAVSIKTDAVTTAKIDDSAVTTAKINNDAVTVDKLNLISTSSVPSLEAKGTSGQTEGYIQLNCAENSHGIKLKSPPHSAGQSYTLTFPSTSPASNKMIQTDGSGNLSFVDAPSGGLQFIQSQIVTSNTTVVNFNDVFSSSYDNYLFIFDATLQNVAQMEMRYRTGTPTNDNYTGANTYRYAFSGQESTNGSVAENSNGNNKWTMGSTTYAAINIGPPAVHGFIHINTPFTSGNQTTWSGTITVYNNGDRQQAFSGGGRIVNGISMTGFGFSCSNGDFTKLVGRVYGVVDS